MNTAKNDRIAIKRMDSTPATDAMSKATTAAAKTPPISQNEDTTNQRARAQRRARIEPTPSITKTSPAIPYTAIPGIMEPLLPAPWAVTIDAAKIINPTISQAPTPSRISRTPAISRAVRRSR